MTLKVAIAADHGGFEMKEALKQALPDIEWLDVGAGENMADDDFPDYAFTLAMVVAAGHAPFGIGICGSGVGISMAANRHPMIRAALCQTADVAKLAREHNDANVLALGGRLTSLDDAKKIVDTFLNTPFTGLDRYVRRNRKLALIDDEHDHEGGCCGGHGHDHGHEHAHGEEGDCCGGHHHGHDDDDNTNPGGGCCGGGGCH